MFLPVVWTVVSRSLESINRGSTLSPGERLVATLADRLDHREHRRLRLLRYLYSLARRCTTNTRIDVRSFDFTATLTWLLYSNRSLTPRRASGSIGESLFPFRILRAVPNPIAARDSRAKDEEKRPTYQTRCPRISTDSAKNDGYALGKSVGFGWPPEDSRAHATLNTLTH